MRIKHAISLAFPILLLFQSAAWAEDSDAFQLSKLVSHETAEQAPAPQIATVITAPVTPEAKIAAPVSAETTGDESNNIAPTSAETASDESNISAPATADVTPDSADVAATGVAVTQPPADLWERIRIGFSLAEMDTPLVQEHENWYANRPDYVRRMVERSQRYLYYIVEEVEKRGMPTEIALLPMIESAFNPRAYSRSHASGIWQFIPSTGKNFGLQQNWWFDGRRDIMAATGAALDYLQKLHGMFGSWELALAAYNWGEGNVQRAISHNEARGLPTDFQSLRMPSETRNYVPKLLAVKHVITNPQAFGLELASIPNQPYFTRVATTKHIDMALAARLAETPADEFASLNPGHNRPVINGKDTEYLLLPADKADIFTTNLENYDKPLVSWKSYKLGRGEKLDSVARKFSISVMRLKEVNSIVGHHKLAGGTLLVPLSQNALADADDNSLAGNYTVVDEPEAPTTSGKRVKHVVRKGDTLPGLARRYAVSIEQIKALNHLKSNHLSLGQKLVLNTPPPRMLAANKSAKHFHTSVRKLAATKSLRPSRVTRNKLASTHYTVRRGDTLKSIARHFNVAVNDIQRSNNLSAKRPLSPGSKVLIPGSS